MAAAAESVSSSVPVAELEAILAVAEAAAREAGALIVARAGVTEVEKTKQSDQDLVTLVDKQSEDVIRAAMERHFPHHKMLGEESVAAGSAASATALESSVDSEWLWSVRRASHPRGASFEDEEERGEGAGGEVGEMGLRGVTQSSSPVEQASLRRTRPSRPLLLIAFASSSLSRSRRVVDPIDGTTNFVHGIPCSVVSIAIAHRGVVVVGCILDPYRNELFTAIRGQGAKKNGEPMRVSAETDLKRALFGFGTHTLKTVRETMLRGVAAVGDVSRGVRSFGSAALHLSWVACGRLTGFWELDLSSWDLAAGSLLVEEAGGRCADTRGHPYTLRTRDMFATNGAPDIHEGALEALRRADAQSLP